MSERQPVRHKGLEPLTATVNMLRDTIRSILTAIIAADSSRQWTMLMAPSVV